MLRSQIALTRYTNATPLAWSNFNRTFDIIDMQYETASVVLRAMSVKTVTASTEDVVHCIRAGMILAGGETGLMAEPYLVEIDIDVDVND
ncbi:hypothetical protein FIBSPDRAFT_870036 [Athelia psychrophila]|uniref:Uncharacterized protein n=1 Tax=Athelia psychrophila TaxID=1759441 RepID=A0A166BHM0_9AGAM|nr:hypothetical protein FIBSPDRAFT_870036 [Fibularhizoctonia sp. CBS 109695]